ncbi:hypothetical protein [Massilia sp. CCM 8734]|uniref:hypothetical protein n=1 Tax=Massilia sp. CCM 8734 TaxID=2609283 RepID=UPI00141DC846|nr:hypothetical protein [Massilia sp. CCM 8734]NHZ98507.1 hypothetical protein [Massilia sp. CCM 8734]
MTIRVHLAALNQRAHQEAGEQADPAAKIHPVRASIRFSSPAFQWTDCGARGLLDHELAGGNRLVGQHDRGLRLAASATARYFLKMSV